MEEKEVKNIYAIPANYTDSGYDPYCRDGRDADASCSAQCDGY